MLTSKSKLLVVVFVLSLFSALLSGCSKKEYLFREVNLGMSIDEVKNNESASLKGTYDISGTYSKKLYYVCYDDEFGNGQKVTFEYFFNGNDELARISVYYYGEDFDNALFLGPTKRKLDAKHGYISKEHSGTYEGYVWDCEEYKVYLVYWEEGYVLLEYVAK